ncbi:hypothetical protein NDU88_000181 [Pleurodeles waltl]|uniref:Uncharacterized protein n=1 Tax=Pleurodeles waltl TaxID=8319 RepID=A0AAV7UTB5_PLEWA|nr:hypothetical protein NDU88_000181 [Pleurodeles waltl]
MLLPGPRTARPENRKSIYIRGQEEAWNASSHITCCVRLLIDVRSHVARALLLPCRALSAGGAASEREPAACTRENNASAAARCVLKFWRLLFRWTRRQLPGKAN